MSPTLAPEPTAASAALPPALQSAPQREDLEARRNKIRFF